MYVYSLEQQKQLEDELAVHALGVDEVDKVDNKGLEPAWEFAAAGDAIGKNVIYLLICQITKK